MKSQYLLFLLVASLLMVACGGSQADTADETPPESSTESSSNDSDEPTSLSDAAEKMENAIREATNTEGKKAEVVDFRELKAKLPETMLGMPRTDFSGERSGGFGFNVSQASATYEEGDRRLEVQIVDSGGLGFLKMATAAWTMAEIDRESDDGYERTISIDGNKAYEKYDNRSGRFELTVIVKDRYLASINAEGLSASEAKGVMNRLDLDDLPPLPS